MPDADNPHTSAELAGGDWRALPVGMVLERRQLTVGPQRLRDYFYGAGWPLSDRAGGERVNGKLVAPPSLLFFEPARFGTFVQAMGDRPGLNTENRWEFFAPFPLNEPLTLELSLGQRWTKRSHEYAEFIMDARDADGGRIARGTFVEAWRIVAPASGQSGDNPANAQVATRVHPVAPVLHDVRAVHFSLAMSMAISGPGDFHTDKNIAKAWGYPEPVLAGPQFVVCVAERMRDLLGASFWTRGGLQVKLIRPVFVDSDVEVAFYRQPPLDGEEEQAFEVQLHCDGVLSSTANAGLRAG